MEAESLFPPISREAIRRARARLAMDGQSVEDWASANGYNAKTVYQVLSGSRPCIRGTMFRIAVALVLRPNPDAPPAAESKPLHRPILSEPVSADPYNRGSKFQLGEPVR